MINAHDAIDTAIGGAKTAVDSVTGSATKAAAAATAAAATAATAATSAATSTKGLALGAAMGAMHLLKLARNLEADDVLGLVGLMRRRSNPLGSMLLLGGGIAIGAGIGMLLAPVSGREARGYLLRSLGLMGEKVTDQVETLQGRATEVVGEVQQRAGQVVEQVQEKAGEIAGQVQDKAGQIMEAADAAGDQAEGEGEGEGRKGGRRARSNHNTHLS